ncbi:MAG: gamma-glutamylcyclotransferase family protein [Acidiferrobacterales bacterium]
MRQRLFVYGTLLREDILRKVIGFLPASEPATLNGYRRMRPGGKPWPVIRPALTSQVNGRVLTGLNRRHLLRIDHYEGKGYKRKRVRVRLPDDRHCHAWTYVGAAKKGEAWSNESEQQHRRQIDRFLSGLRR